MTINELYSKLQYNLGDILNGSFVLDGNCIIWSYDINDYINSCIDNEVDDENDDYFNECLSNEDILNDKYSDDIEKIHTFLDKEEIMEKWNFSSPDILDETISFKIF